MEEPASSPERPPRIYTCTPVSFVTEARFFARDTGLIHTRLKALGAESRCILALPHREGDLPDPEGRVIRATLQQLESPDWWRALDIDGVFLYSWGAPRYRKVARAIHLAGIRLAIHLDMGAAPTLWDRTLPLPKRIARMVRELVVDFQRARHLSYADVITASVPVQKELGGRLFYRKLAGRYHTMPCPVVPHFEYDGTVKTARVIAVGRWNDVRQKRPQLLMQALEQMAARAPGVEAEVYGTMTDDMRAWHAGLPEGSRERIHLCGFVPSAELPKVYKRAQVVFCPSLFESSCIAVAEGLCCGCSVVCSDRPGLMDSVMDYATTPGCGRLPKQDTGTAMADALAAELESWQNGERDPHAIASRWQAIFHVDGLLSRIFGPFQIC